MFKCRDVIYYSPQFCIWNQQHLYSIFKEEVGESYFPNESLALCLPLTLTFIHRRHRREGHRTSESSLLLRADISPFFFILYGQVFVAEPIRGLRSNKKC